MSLGERRGNAMPVHPLDHDVNGISRFSRLSASQANKHRRCPRQWWYESVWKLRIPVPPILSMGTAVESIICSVLKESPALVVEEAGPDVLKGVPLDASGRPDRSILTSWPAEHLLPLPESRRPDSLESLRTWCHARATVHFDPGWDAAERAWSEDPNRVGSWADLDRNRVEAMVLAGLDLHLDQVEACYEAEGGPRLEAWRQGHRPDWPAPDGRAYRLGGGHPLATMGSITWVEAWELARPWFVEPEAQGFTMGSVHPDGWFQGEYDLVYRWDGHTRIVDLKASIGTSDRSGDYVDQLRMYAMLWSATHEGEIPAALEVWYLGVPCVKSIDVPGLKELKALEGDLSALHARLHGPSRNIDDHPPEPAPLRAYLPGGVPDGEGTGSVCDMCPWMTICEGPSDVTLDDGGLQHGPGEAEAIECTPIGSLRPRFEVAGTLLNMRRPRRSHEGPMLILSRDGHEVKVVTGTGDRRATIPPEVSTGATVRLIDAMAFTSRQGDLMLRLDAASRIEVIDDVQASDPDLFSFGVRTHVIGTVTHRDRRSGSRNGRTWSWEGVGLVDATGSVFVKGWGDAWPSHARGLQCGDRVLVLNAELGEFAGRAQLDLTPHSKILRMTGSTP